MLRTHLHGIAKDIAATVHTARPESVSSEDEDAEEGEEEIASMAPWRKCRCVYTCMSLCACVCVCVCVCVDANPTR